MRLQQLAIVDIRLGNYTSGKSTQNAFIFIPYKKLAKLSLNLLRLSCISCKCMMFASRSAIESENSAKAGSNDSRGKIEWPEGVLSRNELRERGRSGVEGRDGGLEREAETERLGFWRSITIACLNGTGARIWRCYVSRSLWYHGRTLALKTTENRERGGLCRVQNPLHSLALGVSSYP